MADPSVPAELERVVATYHPAVALRRRATAYADAIVADARRALGELPGELRGARPERGSLQGTVLAVDAEWAGDELLTWAASDGAAVVSWDVADGEPALALSPTRVWVYYGAEDVLRLKAAGVLPSGVPVRDAWWLARLEWPGRPSYALEALASDELGVEPWKGETPGGDARAWTPRARRERCERDAWATWHLARLLARRVAASAPEYGAFVSEYGPAYWRMAWAGYEVHGLGALLKQLEELRETRAARLRELGLDGSPLRRESVRAWLFERLGIPVESYTPTGLPSVGRKGLAALRGTLSATQAEAVAALEAWSLAEKGCQLARGAWRAGVAWDPQEDAAWVSVPLRPLATATGRRSPQAMDGHRLNTQNWPRWLRRTVRSRWPGGRILTLDYRQLEPRILAVLSGSSRLQAHFCAPDGTGYVGLASELWRRQVERGDTRYRAAKAIILGCHYGMGPERMARELWATGLRLARLWEEHSLLAKRAWRRYHDLVPELRAWMDRCAAEALDSGGVRVLTGRVVPVAADEVQRAANAPVQGLASDITAAAVLDVEHAVLDRCGLRLEDWEATLRDYALARRRGLRPELPRVPVVVNEVHDSLVVDCPPESLRWVADVVSEAMCEVPSLRSRWPETRAIPLAVDGGLNEHWE